MALHKQANGRPTKRHGHHQKRSRPFMRVYAPYIPLLMIVFANLSIGFGWHQQTPAKSVLAYATSMSPQALLDSTNVQRAAYSAGSLALNGKLNTAAQNKANDMAARNYWSHNTPDGNLPWVFITNAGYSYSRAGENLAYGFTEVNGTLGVTTGWMNSPSHKENLINPAYTEVGFGVANAATYQGHSEETIVVAMYATPYGSAPASTPKPAAAAPSVKAQAAAPAATPSAPPAAAPAPEPDHQVTITVLDDSGKPAPFVKVTLHSFPQVGYTNKDGVVTFDKVELGEHTVTAETAYGTVEKKVQVASAELKSKITVEKPLPANQTTSTSTTTAKPLPSAKTSLLSSLTHGSLPWLSAALSVMAIAGICFVALKHSIKLHKLIAKGEKYILHHTLLDVTIVNLAFLCFMLSKTIGTIL